MDKDPESPVTVANVPNEIEAGVIVSALDAAGIKARMVGEYTSGFRAEAPGQVAIVVRSEDEQRARAVLDEAENE